MNTDNKNPFYTEDKRVIELLDKAVSLSEDGQYQKAVDVYKSIIIFEPENGIAQIGKAYAEYKMAVESKDYASQINITENYFLTVADCIERLAAYGVDDEYVKLAIRFIDTCEDEAMRHVELFEDVTKTIIDSYRQVAEEVRSGGWPYNMTEQDKTDMDNDVLPQITRVIFMFKKALFASNKVIEVFVSSIDPEKLDATLPDTLKTLKENIFAKKRVMGGKTIQACADILKPFFSTRAPSKIAQAIREADSIDEEYDDTVYKIDALIREFKDVARERYWAEHAEERRALELKMSDLEAEIETKREDCERQKAEVFAQIGEKDSEIADAEKKADADVQAELDKVAALKKEKSSIGFFNFKEKKVAKEKIKEAIGEVERVRRAGLDVVQNLKAQKSTLEDKIRALDKAFSSKKFNLEKEICDIKDEFEKDR